jgi:NAD-dependent dihydropyrimidine dehydrogenase PreA subunit
MTETRGNPISPKKADPTNEADCIFCFACETQCEHGTIKIVQA